MVYYNEHDPFAAAWLRELITAGHIAFGVVDERSIEDVLPSELRQFKQCHFFAGIGVWSYALRRAGWPDDRQIWTGSCPCQPFSAAGKGDGFDDERHLWPAFHHLIEQCKPNVVFGEQVASKDGLAWLDLVLADLEGTGYAAGAVDTCSAGFGAPHIRQRLYWLADSNMRQPRGRSSEAGGTGEEIRIWPGVDSDDSCCVSRMGNNNNTRSQGYGRPGQLDATEGQQDAPRHCAETSALSGLGDALDSGRQFEPNGSGRDGARVGEGRREQVESGEDVRSVDATPTTRPTNGFWRDADWLFCRDGKWRPVRPGTFPLAHGVAARVGRLRGYGNALNAEAAQGFIEAYMSATL